MTGKIFYRERLKVGVKERKPRFKLVAVAGVVKQKKSMCSRLTDRKNFSRQR